MGSQHIGWSSVFVRVADEHIEVLRQYFAGSCAPLRLGFAEDLACFVCVRLGAHHNLQDAQRHSGADPADRCVEEGIENSLKRVSLVPGRYYGHGDAFNLGRTAQEGCQRPKYLSHDIGWLTPN